MLKLQFDWYIISWYSLLLGGIIISLFASLFRFKNIPTVSPPGSSRYIFDWNPCTKISEGDGCKNMLVGALKGF